MSDLPTRFGFLETGMVVLLKVDKAEGFDEEPVILVEESGETTWVYDDGDGNMLEVPTNQLLAGRVIEPLDEYTEAWAAMLRREKRRLRIVR
ncbi:hypothetical protein LCGC14_0252320 [marine sediment metagenome]|uniref:Uncharacterized protein n=1 Tax=marine sediment metagenome TaxID=412755 RepID=A0A0F9U4J8_9ZZZZ